jgi:hypothetical protein
MSDARLSKLTKSEPLGELVQKNAFEVLQELERYGYVRDPESAPSPRGMLMRHPSAPDLVLGDDGRLDLLFIQPTEVAVQSRVVTRRVFWRRGLSFLTLLVILTFLGLALVLNLLLAT